MRRRVLIAVLTGALGATAAAAAGLAIAAGAAGAAANRRTAATRRPAAPPARMLVYAQEWTLYGSRASVPAGHVIVQLWNRGQDAHDLRIRRLNKAGQMVGRAQGVKITGSGAISEANWKLGRGRYEIYCALPQHRSRGMHTRLRVG